MNDADLALLELLRRLDDEGYDFTPPTPLTHARVIARPARSAGRTLRDILGWSLPFTRDAAPGWLVEALERGGALEPVGDRLKSRLRVSRLHGLLFLHSAFPTDQADAVFLGPDSYRFADFVGRELTGAETGRLLDIGGGAGAGALCAGRAAPGLELWLTDINPKALRLARINAAHAGQTLNLREASGVDGAPEGLQLALANPPYIAGADQTYADGGGMHGGRLSLDWATAALPKLAPGGRLLLYTGAAILDGGRDPLKAALSDLAARHGAAFRYQEIDPDVFGEELETPAYADVERIAAIGCVIQVRG